MVHYGKLMITLKVETVCNTGSASNSERCARLHGKNPKDIKSWYEKLLLSMILPDQTGGHRDAATGCARRARRS